MQQVEPKHGLLILTAASVLWGLGNALTGMTASKYSAAADAVGVWDVALANILGGAALLVGIAIVRAVPLIERNQRPSGWLPGALKGANTVLFVVTASMSVSSVAVILENLYVLLSFAGAVLIGGAAVLSARTVAAAVTLSLATGILTFSGEDQARLLATPRVVAAGVGAAIAYSLYLHAWRAELARPAQAASSVTQTLRLLLVATGTILLAGTAIIGARTHSLWIPLRALAAGDAALQLANGAVVVGLVYLLVAEGMKRTERSGRDGALAAALVLSMSTVVTYLVDWARGTIVATPPTAAALLAATGAFAYLNRALNPRKSDQ